VGWPRSALSSWCSSVEGGAGAQAQQPRHALCDALWRPRIPRGLHTLQTQETSHEQRIETRRGQSRGKIKGAIGKAIGNEQMQAEGKAKELQGEAKQAAAKGAERTKGAIEEVVGAVKNRVGAVIDNEQMQVEGKAKELQGEARQKANK
jgi:uncharacterized protein YjbJ (UPF0337 family)